MCIYYIYIQKINHSLLHTVVLIEILLQLDYEDQLTTSVRGGGHKLLRVLVHLVDIKHINTFRFDIAISRSQYIDIAIAIYRLRYRDRNIFRFRNI